MQKVSAIRRRVSTLRFIDAPSGNWLHLTRWACQPQAIGSGLGVPVSGASVAPCLIVAAGIVAWRPRANCALMASACHAKLRDPRGLRAARKARFQAAALDWKSSAEYRVEVSVHETAVCSCPRLGNAPSLHPDTTPFCSR
jgi:hypothetical protein